MYLHRRRATSSNKLLVEAMRTSDAPKIPEYASPTNDLTSFFGISQHQPTYTHIYIHNNNNKGRDKMTTVWWRNSCFWLSMTSAWLVPTDAFAGIQQSSASPRFASHSLRQHSTQASTTTTLALSSTTTTTPTTTNNPNDLLQPAYEIERIPIRIGHGFDIHRMAPLEEAGQPLIIGGVHVTHKDQKVRRDIRVCVCVCVGMDET